MLNGRSWSESPANSAAACRIRTKRRGGHCWAAPLDMSVTDLLLPHRVDAAVDVNHFAGSSGEPVRQQRAYRARGGLGIVDVPTQGRATCPTGFHVVESRNGLRGGGPNRPS